MSSAHLLAVVALFLLLFLLLRRRRTSTPPVPPAPGGLDQIGIFRNLPVRNPVTAIQPAPEPASFGSGAPSPFSAEPRLTREQTDEIAKLDSLRASGTLSEAEYGHGRARVLGTSANEAASWNITVLSSGDNKITAIKLLRECRRDFDLKQAKDFVDTLPQMLFRRLPQAEAERVKDYLERSGVSVRLDSEH